MARSRSLDGIPFGLGCVSTLAILFFGVSGILVPFFTLGIVLQSSGSIEFLFSHEMMSLVRGTLEQAFLSTFFSGVFGLALGIWIGGRSGRISRSAELLLAIPFGVPSVVVAFSWVLWLGRSGFLAQFGLHWDLLYSFKAVILAHVFLNTPWVALLVAQTRRTVPMRRLEASTTLGAGVLGQWSWIVWPHVQWAFLSACTQVFAFCVMSFALVLMLGGGPSVQTLETALYSHLRYGGVDISRAVACAFWELVLTLGPWILVLLFEAQQGKVLTSENFFVQSSSKDQKSVFFRERLSSIGQFVAAALFLIPYGAVLSTLSSGLSLGFEKWGVSVRSALQISLEMAVLTGFGALFVSVLALIALNFLGRWPRIKFISSIFLLLPSGISAMVLGLGVWLAYRSWIDPFSGKASAFVAIVGLQTVLYFPVAFRVLWPVSRNMPMRQFEVAATLGCSSLRAFWLLDWPRWKAPCLSAFALVAAATFGEVAVVSLFYHEDLVTLPLLISRWMAQYRFHDAEVLAALLFILSASTVIFILRRSHRVGQRFLG